MAAPGYFQVNFAALTEAEVSRVVPPAKLRQTLAAFRKCAPSGIFWLPALASEDACAPEQLSESCHAMLRPLGAAIERLGFTRCTFLKMNSKLNHVIQEMGAISFLHHNRQYRASAVYQRMRVRKPVERIEEAVEFQFSFASESESISFAQRSSFLDSVAGRRRIEVASADPAVVYAELVRFVERERPVIREFRDCADAIQFGDEQSREWFEALVARGVFVRMRDEEVAAALRGAGE